MTPTDATSLADVLAQAAGGRATHCEIGPLDLWNAHRDGNGPGWTVRLDLRLPPGADPHRATDALDALGVQRWSTEIRRPSRPEDGPSLRLVCALRACDWPSLLAATGAHLSAHDRASIAAGGGRIRRS